jgi:hypothetical protein
MEYIDYLRPIIADADTGSVNTSLELQTWRIDIFRFSHGGLSAVMKLVKLFAESVSCTDRCSFVWRISPINRVHLLFT